MAATEIQEPRTYGNWRKPTSAGILGLGTIGTALLLVGLVVVVLTALIGGLLKAVVLAAVLAVLMVAVLSKDRHGRNVVSRASARGAWWWARSQRTNVYRSGPLGRSLWGTFQLPGLAASTRLSEHEDSYGRLFGMLYTPATSSYSVVIGTEPDGAALVDEEQIDAWVADWGHWLANLGDEPGIESASVTIETAPDTGTRLHREVMHNLDPDAPAFAQAMLEQVVDAYPSGSSTVKAYVAITFGAANRKGSKKRQAEEMGHELATRLPGLTAALQATGAGAAHPLTAQDLCEVVRVAYDPASAVLIDEAHSLGQHVELTWPDVGPVSAEAAWDSYRHDSGYSVTWEMTEAPRGTVQSGILARLLTPHQEIARKRVSLLYRPIDAARAAAIVEADLRAAARDTLAVRAASATANEEATGAGLVQFGMLVTATVMDPAQAADARAAVDNLAATARLRLRTVYGSQDSAFAAALPLGLNMSKHLRVPSEFREKF